MSDVIELTTGNFNQQVQQSDSVWVVTFMAPWSDHCHELMPELEKAANALEGVAKVGTVDMSIHGSLGALHHVREFPTIKIFGTNKNATPEYHGARSAQAITDEALRVLTRVVQNRLSLSGHIYDANESGYQQTAPVNSVIELTDANFDAEVLNSPQPILVHFFAPWSGHCQRLAPEWQQAAAELQNKVKFADINATIHTESASKLQVQGYPTLKVFPPRAMDYSGVKDYQGGRTAADIVQYGLELAANNIQKPEVQQLLDNTIFRNNVHEKPLGVIAFLSATQDDEKVQAFQILDELSEKYKAKLWGWSWTEAGVHPNLEQALGISTENCPTLVVISDRKQSYVRLNNEFTLIAIDELLRNIAVGRVPMESLSQGLPNLATVNS